MHTFLVRSLNQQGFLIRDFKILSVTARDLTHKSAARPTGPIHASHIFPCEKETLNYHQGHRKGGKPCNRELILTAPVLAAFSENSDLQKMKAWPATLLQYCHPGRVLQTSAGAIRVSTIHLPLSVGDNICSRETLTLFV